MFFTETYYENNPHVLQKGPLTIRKWQNDDPQRIVIDGGILTEEFTSYPIEIEIKQDGLKMNMSSLLPPNWRVVESEAANETNGICAEGDIDTYVAIPILGKDSSGKDAHFLETDYSFCALLHEIGHSWQEYRKTYEECAISRFVRQSLASRLEVASNILPTDEENELLVEHVYKYERGAWLHALKTFRDMMQAGLTLEPNLTIRDIVKDVNKSLSGYRRYLEERKGVSF